MGLLAGFFCLVHPIGLIYGSNYLDLGALAGLLCLLTTSRGAQPQVMSGLVGGIYLVMQFVSENSSRCL